MALSTGHVQRPSLPLTLYVCPWAALAGTRDTLGCPGWPLVTSTLLMGTFDRHWTALEDSQDTPQAILPYGESQKSVL